MAQGSSGDDENTDVSSVGPGKKRSVPDDHIGSPPETKKSRTNPLSLVSPGEETEQGEKRLFHAALDAVKNRNKDKSKEDMRVQFKKSFETSLESYKW